MLLCGCSDTPIESQFEEIIIDFDLRQNFENGLVSESEVIRFDLPDGLLIGRIDRLIVLNNKIVILDKTQNSVFVFDESGRMLVHLNKEGYGPGEYSDILDVSIYEKDNHIEIIDHSRQIILTYSLLNGEFLFKTKYDFFTVHSLRNSEDYRIFNNQGIPNGALNGGGSQMIYLTDLNNKVVKKEFDFFWSPKEQNYSIPRYNMFRHSNKRNEINVIPLHTTDVYGIIESNFFPKYSFDFGRKTSFNLIKEIGNVSNSEFMRRVYDERYIHSLTNFLETESRIYFSVQLGAEAYQVLVNKESKEQNVFKLLSTDPIGITIPPAITAHDDYFYSILPNENSPSMINYIEKKKSKELLSGSRLYGSIKDASILDNGSPLLIKYKFGN